MLFIKIKTYYFKIMNHRTAVSLTFTFLLDIPVVSPRRFLVYINPFSGSGKAMQIYEKDVKRLFSEAEITHTMFKTSEF